MASGENEAASPKIAWEVNVRMFDVDLPDYGKSVQLLRIVCDEDPRSAIICALANLDKKDARDEHHS